MKRFHVHVAVKDLEKSIRFYSALFGVAPAFRKPDYAKWVVEDPRINFAISQRAAAAVGIDHLGLQVDTDDELQALRERAAAAELAVTAQQGASCCYARSNKYWYSDPQGIAWETFHTLAQVEFFGSQAGGEPLAAAEQRIEPACCEPALQVATAERAGAECCR